MNEKSEITVIVGRTAEGFLRWLREHNLNAELDLEWLAEMIVRTIEAFEKNDVEERIRIIRELADRITNEGKIEVTKEVLVEAIRQFGRLCDTYRTFFMLLKAVVEREEEYEKKQ